MYIIAYKYFFVLTQRKNISTSKSRNNVYARFQDIYIYMLIRPILVYRYSRLRTEIYTVAVINLTTYNNRPLVTCMELAATCAMYVCPRLYPGLALRGGATHENAGAYSSFWPDPVAPF